MHGNLYCSTLLAPHNQGDLIACNASQLSWSGAGVTLGNCITTTPQGGRLAACGVDQLRWSNSGVCIPQTFVANTSGGRLMSNNVTQLGWDGNGLTVSGSLMCEGLTADSGGGKLVSGGNTQLTWSQNGIQVCNSLLADQATGCLMAGNSMPLRWDENGLAVSTVRAMDDGGACLTDTEGNVQLEWDTKGVTVHNTLMGPSLISNISGGSLASNGCTSVAWFEGGGCLSNALIWSSNGSVNVSGPLKIAKQATPAQTPNTANVQLVDGTVPTDISCGLVCEGDIVSLGGGFFVLSDQRHKRGVHERCCHADLSTLEDLKPVSFQYRSSTLNRIGMVADDVVKILPEAVQHTGDKELCLDYSVVTAVHVNATKALAQRLRKVESMLDSLRE